MNTTEKKLAHLVRQHPNLYNHARQDYKDNLRGHLSLKEIAGNMGKTEDEVKLIWKNLRDKFCKAKRRMGSRRRDSLLERPGPVLLVQLSWLNPFIKPKGTVLGETHEGAGSRDKLENEDGTVKHHCLSVAASNISPLEPNMYPEVTPHKSGKQTANEPELTPTETLSSVLRDEDELFLLSLLPSMKRLNIKKRMEVRMKFQQVLYTAEFEDLLC